MVAIQAAEQGHVGLALLERSDGPQLRRLFFRLSAQTLYRRFHSPVLRPEQAQPQRLLDVDHHDREAVVAVVVADDWQRQGLATRMLSALHDRAQSEGVRQFTMSMQADNRPVVQLFRRFYPEIAMTHSQGMLEAVVPVAR